MKKEITISTLINAPINRVWKCFTTPSDIKHWNNASEDWHTPFAKNDLKVGGIFTYRMESKDKKYGFDFGGTYTKIIPYTRIDYTLGDGRKVSNTFSSGGAGITVEIIFETEQVNSEEQQRVGWQAILDNFKEHVESQTGRTESQPIVPCLWFNNRAEEAVKFYMSVFKDSEIIDTLYYSEAGREIHGHEAGSLLTIDFRINSQRLTALNGGPEFEFNEAVSLQVMCDTQAEIDFYWERLTEGGEEGPCGWLKDKFGVSWQVAPTILIELLKDPSRAEKVTDVYMKMKKFDINALLRA